jgi:hypothetical protein
MFWNPAEAEASDQNCGAVLKFRDGSVGRSDAFIHEGCLTAGHSEPPGRRVYCKRYACCSCVAAVNRILGDTPTFSYVWQRKGLERGKFVCVAAKGVMGGFFRCLAVTGVKAESGEWFVDGE